MHGSDKRYKDTRYGVAGGCMRSAADTLCYTAVLILAIGGVLAVELTTESDAVRAAAAGSAKPTLAVAARPFETVSPSAESTVDASAEAVLSFPTKTTPRIEAGSRAHATARGAGAFALVVARPFQTERSPPPLRPPADASAKVGGPLCKPNANARFCVNALPELHTKNPCVRGPGVLLYRRHEE